MEQALALAQHENSRHDRWVRAYRDARAQKRHEYDSNQLHHSLQQWQPSPRRHQHHHQDECQWAEYQHDHDDDDDHDHDEESEESEEDADETPDADQYSIEQQERSYRPQKRSKPSQWASALGLHDLCESSARELAISRKIRRAQARAEQDPEFKRRKSRSRWSSIIGTGTGALLGAAICAPFLPAVPWCAAAGAGIGAGIADAVSPDPQTRRTLGSSSRKIALAALAGGVGGLVPGAQVISPAITGALAGWVNTF